MNEQEAVAYIEEWDVTEAAKVLKWYEEDKLLRPCDCDTIVAIETEDLQAENAKLREQNAKLLKLLEDMKNAPCCGDYCWMELPQRLRELGIEVPS